MRFPLGAPIIALVVAALGSGVEVWRAPPMPRADVVIWTFADTHAQLLRDVRHGPSLLEQFQSRSGLYAQVRLMGQSAENIRLASAFSSGVAGGSVPDLCEIEVDSIGQFLRPPAPQIGLLPLNDFLRSSGWDKGLVPSRLQLYSKVDLQTGHELVYGIPEDVHPVTLTYRKDLFDEAGIDLSGATTWKELQALCLQFQDFWTSHGYPSRRALALSSNGADDLVQMLLQRRINLIDAAGHLHFRDAKVLDTAIFYAGLVAGTHAVAAEPSPGLQWTDELERGSICGLLTPDWKAQYMEQFSPNLLGKLRMIALPRFESQDAPTSTSGGTMIGICRTCPDPQAAWKCLEFLCLSHQSHRAAIAAGDFVLPAAPAYWSDPAYHAPDRFFAGDQSTGDLYVALASQLPDRVVTPYTYQSELALGVVVERSTQFLSAHPDGDGLAQACAKWLNDAQADLQARLDFGSLQP